MCDFEEFDVNFKIISNQNEDLYVEGYVTINDEDAEDVDWYYWNGNGYDSQRTIFHDGVQISGATWEQENEIAQFESDLADDCFFIDEVILQSEEDENRTYVREKCTLIINEGAKMECEIIENVDPEMEYVVKLIPKFNGELVELAEYMSATGEEFDPYDENGYCEIKNGHIFFEISKSYFDEELREEELELINEELCRIYARSLTYKLRIYAKYGDVMEQALDDSYDEEWLFKFSNVTDENLDDFLHEEGFIIDDY